MIYNMSSLWQRYQIKTSFKALRNDLHLPKPNQLFAGLTSSPSLFFRLLQPVFIAIALIQNVDLLTYSLQFSLYEHCCSEYP